MQYPSILVVDDDEDDRLLIQLGFEKANFLDLGLFADGPSVLQYLQSNSERLPKLIVSDYNMPKLSGLELLKSIKADNSLMHIDVIILSTSSSQSYIDNCINCGATGYYVKPSSEKEIIDIAKEILLKVKFLGKGQLA
jgi:chemosensory pili system protein ChpA (sensor histidine kinase/response regulator)